MYLDGVIVPWVRARGTRAVKSDTCAFIHDPKTKSRRTARRRKNALADAYKMYTARQMPDYLYHSLDDMTTNRISLPIPISF